MSPFLPLLPDNANVRGEDVAEFLRQLKERLGGAFTVLRDGSRVHERSKCVKDFLAAHSEIVAETLPAYAPELNPDELVWGWSNYGRLSNLAAESTDRLCGHVIDELSHLRKRPDLLRSFLNKTKLTMAA